MKIKDSAGFGRSVWPILVAMAVVGLAYTVSSPFPIHAQEATPEPSMEVVSPTPPLGDCYDGVLSEEQMHCYMLEQAEAKNVIDIVAIYDAKGRLFVYLRQTGDFTNETRAFLKEKATYFYEQWPDLAPRGTMYDGCRESGASDRWCLLEAWFLPESWLKLPPPNEYLMAQLRPGGVDSRRSVPGWASWTQLWPSVAFQRSASGNSKAGTYDISDVDLTHFPTPAEVDCSNWSANGCGIWRRWPESGIAGWSLGPDPAHETVAKIYLQVKQPPQDSAQLQTLKEGASETYGGLDVAEVSVKYDFGESLRWATILERFAVSNGNTIGVVGAGITGNIAFPPDHDVVWATTRISPVVDISINSSAVRHAVILYAYDAQEVANALPVLLPQLGIPTDGVGVIQGVREYSAGLVSLDPLQEPTTPGPSMEVVSSTPPLGDCYGSVLAAEPMHCYMLERAEAKDLIDVESIYDVKDSLAIYLRETDQVDDATAVFLKEKASYFYEQWPDLTPRGSVYEECQHDFSYEDCLLNLATIFRWDPSTGTLRLPWAEGFTAVLMHTGGAESRQSVGGWASWEQLWPAIALQKTVRSTGDRFDISDVDLTNFPQLDRRECSNPPTYMRNFCYMWVLYPQSGVAGYYSVGYEDEGVAKVHLYVKSPPPGDESQLEALKARLTSGYWKGDEVVVVSVKYHYEELWRWATILNRFAISAGNTIGIGGAFVFHNRGGVGDPNYVWPVQGFGPTRENRDLRPTIRLEAIDANQVATALPTLLSQLSIPLDAVGIVRQGDSGRLLTGKVVALGNTSEDGVTPNDSAPGDTSDSNSVETPSEAVRDASVERDCPETDSSPTVMAKVGGAETTAGMDEAPQSAQSPAEVVDSQNNETAGTAGISSQTVAVAAVGEAVSSAPIPAADDLTLASNGVIPTYVIVGSAAAGLVVLASATLLAVRLRRREG